MESTFLVHFHPASTQKNEYSVKNIWKSYIWTADKDVNESDPRSNVHYLGSSENKAWKNYYLFTFIQEWILSSFTTKEFSVIFSDEKFKYFWS